MYWQYHALLSHAPVTVKRPAVTDSALRYFLGYTDLKMKTKSIGTLFWILVTF